MVALETDHVSWQMDTVRVDHETAFYENAAHLLEIGRRNLAFLGSAEDAPLYCHEVRGIQRALSKYGGTLSIIKNNNFTVMDGYHSVKVLLQEAAMPDGIICANDQVAAGALNACSETGICIPSEVAITGFGGNGGNDFATHMLEQELSGIFDVAHGAGLSALWGSWARYVYRDCLDRFCKYAVNVMGVKGATDEETALKGIEATEAFFREIHMPVSLKELNLDPTEEEMDLMAHKCIIAAGGKKGSAKVLFEEDLRKILEMAR